MYKRPTLADYEHIIRDVILNQYEGRIPCYRAAAVTIAQAIKKESGKLYANKTIEAYICRMRRDQVISFISDGDASNGKWSKEMVLFCITEYLKDPNYKHLHEKVLAKGVDKPYQRVRELLVNLFIPFTDRKMKHYGIELEDIRALGFDSYHHLRSVYMSKTHTKCRLDKRSDL